MTINNFPKMLAVRAPRESCLAFYAKFKKMNVTYLAGTNSNYKPSVIFPSNVNLIVRKFYPNYWSNVTNLSIVGINGLEELIKSTDIVNITDTYYSFNAEAIYYAKKYNKKIVTIIWATIPNHISSILPPYSFFTKMVVDNTDLFILRNKTAYRFTDSLGIDRSKTKLIYKGVDLNHFYPAKRLTINHQPLVILYVGIYHPSKGLRELIEAFERLVKSGLPVRLHFAGKGPMNDYINKKATVLPIINHGFVAYSDLANLYRSADIFCSPSKEIRFLGIKIWEEYFSYTLMEAQASGLPIVTTNSGGIPEEVDCRNPIVEIGNVTMLFNALKKVVTDSKLRQKLSIINRKRAEKLFDASLQAEITESEILNLVGVHG